MPNMFGGDQFDELYAPHMHQRTTPPAQPDANPEQGLVTDEENERFSRDVSNFKGADPEATKYALEQFLKNRGQRPAQTPPPRLTDSELVEIYRQVHPVERRTEGKPYVRAVESAVRKQWARQFGMNDE